MAKQVGSGTLKTQCSSVDRSNKLQVSHKCALVDLSIIFSIVFRYLKKIILTYKFREVPYKTWFDFSGKNKDLTTLDLQLLGNNWLPILEITLSLTHPSVPIPMDILST